MEVAARVGEGVGLEVGVGMGVGIGGEDGFWVVVRWATGKRLTDYPPELGA